MSVDYASGLSHYDDLGDCGLDEVFDKIEVVKEKVKQLADLLRQHNGSCVVHVGAGISTSAGIRDFRGKNGVWTELQQKSTTSSGATNPVKTEQATTATSSVAETKQRVNEMKPFDETEPTFTHLALKKLCEQDLVRHIISQNVDGLFLKANLPRKFLSELHGNFYLDECTKCRSRFIRSTASTSMRLTKSDVKCPRAVDNCKGRLRDTILDWESPIPYNELRLATKEGKRNLLHICLGTSMQLRPSKDLVCDPTRSTENSRKLVIINLQPTKLDQKANLVINFYADDVMRELMSELDLEVDPYDASRDPTKDPSLTGNMWSK